MFRAKPWKAMLVTSVSANGDSGDKQYTLCAHMQAYRGHTQTHSACLRKYAGVLSERHNLSSLAPESFPNPVR